PFLARPCVPDFHGCIIAGRGEELPVGAVRHPHNKLGMPAKDKDLVAGGHVPDPHGLIVLPTGSEPLTIRAARRVLDVVSGPGMERGGLNLRALGIEIPDLGGYAGGGETPSVGGKDYIAEVSFVGLECTLLFAGGRVPDCDLSVAAARS